MVATCGTFSPFDISPEQLHPMEYQIPQFSLHGLALHDDRKDDMGEERYRILISGEETISVDICLRIPSYDCRGNICALWSYNTPLILIQSFENEMVN